MQQSADPSLSDIQFPAHVRSKFLSTKYIKILPVYRDHIHAPRIFKKQKILVHFPHVLVAFDWSQLTTENEDSVCKENW
jgi:hypothetical protein